MIAEDDWAPENKAPGADENSIGTTPCVPARDPEGSVPTDDAVRRDFGTVKVSIRKPGRFEVYFQAPVDVITFSTDRFDRNAVAFDSDKVEIGSTVPGAMHFHPAGSRVYCRNDYSPEARFTVLEVDPGLRKAIEAEMRQGPVSLRTMINISTPQSAMLAQSAEHFIRQGALANSLVADALATLAVNESLLALSGDQAEDRTHPLLGQQALTRTLDYIEGHLEDDIRLADLAAIACLSPHHFSRAFKASTGRPPSIYVLERRVERAKTLLLSSDEPLTSIALQCGFSSQSHMTTAFRRVVAMTPARFRKEARG